MTMEEILLELEEMQERMDELMEMAIKGEVYKYQKP